MAGETEQAKIERLRRELEKAEQRAQWEAEQPEAIKDAFARGASDGWSQGWQDALQFLGQLALKTADIHRKHLPEPEQVSLEKIARMLEQLRPANAEQGGTEG